MRTQINHKACAQTVLGTLASLLAGILNAGDRVDSIGITVGDLDKAIEFYTDVLDFEPVVRWEVDGDEYEHAFGVFGLRVEIARLRLGEEYIELIEFLAPHGRPIPVDSQSNDAWFQHIAVIVSDMDRAYRRLRDNGVTHASSGPQVLPAWNPNAAGIAAFYFRDPDGNHLEILAFPPDKGQPKWHTPTERLFLGIDHTAIVVADTDASLAYYRDTLGMTVAGHSENYGIEQERLNNVFGARLRITALRAATGPGVELLEYLAPRTGRPMPIDSRANDLWYWQVNLETDALEVLGSRLAEQDYRYVSSGLVEIESNGSWHGVRRPAGVLIVRDPDGHATEIFSPRVH